MGVKIPLDEFKSSSEFHDSLKRIHWHLFAPHRNFATYSKQLTSHIRSRIEYLSTSVNIIDLVLHFSLLKKTLTSVAGYIARFNTNYL